MNYINFVVITDTPARLRTFLVNRGVIKAVTNPMDGSTQYVGVLPGMEWAKVPNPIQTAPGSGVFGQVGYVPPTYDTRAVHLVKFAHDSEAQKAAGFRDWILANSSVVTAPGNYLINEEPVGDTRKVTGEQVWLAHDRPERFGVWQ